MTKIIIGGFAWAVKPLMLTSSPDSLDRANSLDRLLAFPKTAIRVGTDIAVQAQAAMSQGGDILHADGLTSHQLR